MGVIDEALRAAGIALRHYGNGQHYATCPRCSPHRRKKHLKCLSVTIQPDKALYHCFHCDFKGATYVDTPTPRTAQATRHRAGNGLQAWLGKLR